MTAKRAIVVAFAVGAAIALASTNVATGAARNRAGVVVRHSDRHVERMCVAFGEETISGIELLERSDVPFLTEGSALGSAICRIGATGCRPGQKDAEDCFCEYPTFWGYWTRAPDREWAFSDVGAAGREVRDGDVDGWSWGRDGKPAPPDDTFSDVCGGPARVTSTRSEARAANGDRPRPNYVPFAVLVVVLIALIVLLSRRRARLGRDG
jgi:hypothetical protein